MPSIATWIRQCDEHWFNAIFSRYPHLRIHNARLHPVDCSSADALLLTGGGAALLPRSRVMGAEDSFRLSEAV
jgi:hypothetical protein